MAVRLLPIFISRGPPTMRALLFFLLATAAPGAAFAQAPGAVGYPTVAAALEALKAKPGVKISERDGWTTIDDRQSNAIWTFTPPGHAAHPAVIRRGIVETNGGLGIHMTALCQAAKGPCDRLMEEFTKLNEQVGQNMAGKAATAPAATGAQASAAQVQAVERQSQAYFAAKDGHRLQDAYKMQAPAMTQTAPFANWRGDTERAQASIGAVLQRDIKHITWYKDPPKTRPGLYAAVDYTSRFANANIHCGYLVWQEQADGSFLLVREEENFVDKATEQKLTPQARQDILAQFRCK